MKTLPLILLASMSLTPAFATPQLQSERDALAAQLAQIRSEIQRCERQRTGWTAATVVGSIGVVGTTAGAIYQGVQWRNENQALDAARTDLQNVQAEISAHGQGGQ